jgi:hypothetical protein
LGINTLYESARPTCGLFVGHYVIKDWKERWVWGKDSSSSHLCGRSYNDDIDNGHHRLCCAGRRTGVLRGVIQYSRSLHFKGTKINNSKPGKINLGDSQSIDIDINKMGKKKPEAKCLRFLTMKGMPL